MLVRKYRPLSLVDVIGQDAAVKKLLGAYKAKQLAGVIVITGPTGVGKTTLARLCARLVNCNYKKGYDRCKGRCDSCSYYTEDRIDSHPDIIEHDGATHRGIDDIRALQEEAEYQPQVGNCRVFILDEVHQLTPQAVSAALKVLEDNTHSMFILCTNEPQKLPKTVLGRGALRLDLKAIPEQLQAEYLQRIAQKEGFELPEEAYTTIAHYSQGQMRDALQYLQQIIYFLKGSKKKPRDWKESIDQILSESLGIPPWTATINYLERIFRGDAKGALGICVQIENAQVFLNLICTVLRDLILAQYEISSTSNSFIVQRLGKSARKFGIEKLVASLETYSAAYERTRAYLVDAKDILVITTHRTIG